MTYMGCSSWGGSFIFLLLFKKFFPHQMAGLKGLSLLRKCTVAEDYDV